jgi:hypothetical protein
MTTDPESWPFVVGGMPGWQTALIAAGGVGAVRETAPES